MVEAYTLSDKIVQQGFNDFESVVGAVYKLPAGGSIELSSIEALRASGATPISVGQIATYFVDSNGSYNTYAQTANILSNPPASNIIQRAFGEGWAGERDPDVCDQWIQVRRYDSSPIININDLQDFPNVLCYKLVCDCYLAVVEP